MVELKSLFEEKPYESVVTVPNIITSVGIILLVPYVWGFLTNNRWIMFISLFLSGFSDFLDGGAARMLKQKTWLGEFIDPLRDRLLLLVVLLNIVYLNLDQLLFVLLWGGIIGGFELLTAIYNLILVPPKKRKVYLIGKMRQAGHLLLAGFVILSYYFRDVIYSIAGFDFDFSVKLALPIMAFCSCTAFVCYIWYTAVTERPQE